MKNLLFVLLICLISSCSTTTKKQSNQNIEIPDTTGYFAARNMKGLSSFIIGESKYDEIINILKDEIRKDSKRIDKTNQNIMPRYIDYQSKYLDYKFDKKGNIAGQFYREDFGSTFKEIKFDTIRKYLTRDILEREIFGCPNMKKIKMYKYYVGDIELSDLSLSFYKDTLYEISCSRSDEIEKGFKVKYGNGRFIDNTLWKTPSGETNKRPDDEAILKKSKLLKIDEIIIWENSIIRAESQIYIKNKYDGDIDKGIEFYDNHFKMNSKDENLRKEILNCENEAFKTKTKIEKQDNQKDINKL